MPLWREELCVAAHGSQGTPQTENTEGAGKLGFYKQIGLDQGAAYTFATSAMASGVMTPDAQEGIQAFLDKRPAQFTQPPGAAVR